MFRFLVVTAIAASLSVVSLPIPALAQQIPTTCIPLKTFVPMLTQMTQYSNLRLVGADRTTDAVDLFNSLPPPGPAGKFGFAMLLDGPDDTGFLLMGRGGDICEFAAFDAEAFGKLVRKLEGQRT